MFVKKPRERVSDEIELGRRLNFDGYKKAQTRRALSCTLLCIVYEIRSTLSKRLRLVGHYKGPLCKMRLSLVGYCRCRTTLGSAYQEGSESRDVINVMGITLIFNRLLVLIRQ